MKKVLPFSHDFLEAMLEKYPTPFYVYDERAIRENARNFFEAFQEFPAFQEFFAVKATPNPEIMKLFLEEGCGVDCSSLAELCLAERVGFKKENIFLTSNDTPAVEFQKANDLGAIINLDDISHIDFLEKYVGIPEKICCRYNPGPLRTGNSIIGNPVEAKYGFTREQIFAGFEKLRKKGVKKFAIHTMVASNELNIDYFFETARMMFELAGEIKAKLDIDLNTINLGGGLGIPYYPDEKSIDLNTLAKGVMELYQEQILDQGLYPSKLAFESGRMMTGPYGYLVTKMIHKKQIYKDYACLDACMADLMRPALYGAYHHITVIGKENEPRSFKYDVVGSLCENNDKFAIDRYLPELETGDILVFHDVGAHGHAMGFNYNGKLRPAEILWQGGKESKVIRRAETLDDYFATLTGF